MKYLFALTTVIEQASVESLKMLLEKKTFRVIETNISQ